MNAVQWWGANAHRYPVWASLARDYLAVMASSVSSERAFSSALTLGKLQNRLKGDIVEALQCLKCLYCKDLFFREVVAFDGEEVEMEDEQGPSPPPTIATVSWDEMLIDVNDLADSDVEIDV
ncbi:uncharacterized protein ARMOST_19482 [Armillaria ostoyae]|uniref:HAT C-terminal dimerisation domain-containing protein n=1 Tax=Armillaria ostoyae TaxID=47428 RepID=A0A284S4P6_ARMOS|nr:uncharacterized protein ARMOST_19482 [Armillaria ostoyae]